MIIMKKKKKNNYENIMSRKLSSNESLTRRENIPAQKTTQRSGNTVSNVVPREALQQCVPEIRWDCLGRKTDIIMCLFRKPVEFLFALFTRVLDAAADRFVRSR